MKIAPEAFHLDGRVDARLLKLCKRKYAEVEVNAESYGHPQGVAMDNATKKLVTRGEPIGQEGFVKLALLIVISGVV